MKKSELVIGNTYAYSRTREELPRYIDKVTLISTEPGKGYRDKAGSVLVEFTRPGWGFDKEPRIEREYVQLYTLKGDYDAVLNQIELQKKDMEIQNLKSQIEKNRRLGVLNKYKEAFIKFGVPWHSFSEYRVTFNVEFTEEQFKTVSRLLEAYNKDLAEAQADARESNQAAHMIGSISND